MTTTEWIAFNRAFAEALAIAERSQYDHDAAPVWLEPGLAGRGPEIRSRAYYDGRWWSRTHVVARPLPNAGLASILAGSIITVHRAVLQAVREAIEETEIAAVSVQQKPPQ